MKNINTDYYAGPERRTSAIARRSTHKRRHRIRFESLISDCRQLATRRKEDSEGAIDLSAIYVDDRGAETQPQIEK